MKWLEEKYIHMRIKHKIQADVIIASGDWSRKNMERRKEQFTTTKLVSDTLYPFAHEINIYGDKVAFIKNKKNEALIGILIQHPLIAQTMKALFDLAWR
jgi:hypothetical protein